MQRHSSSLACNKGDCNKGDYSWFLQSEERIQEASGYCEIATPEMLATLFLLSYAKLLRITITAFSFTLLEYPDGSVKI